MQYATRIGGETNTSGELGGTIFYVETAAPVTLKQFDKHSGMWISFIS